MSKSRNWCFTLNNYSGEEEEALGLVECKYIVYGREVGETGTPHLQGTIVFKVQKPLGGVKKINGRAHWEPTKAIHESIVYCKKDGDFFEKGEPPMKNKEKGEKEKLRWKRALELAEEGEYEKLKEEEPLLWLKHRATMMSHKKRKGEIINGELTHEWWYGPPGTGKSKEFHDTYKDFYWKPKNKWWDSYADEDVVLIEEWSPEYKKLTDAMKIWADRYPFTGEIKGGSVTNIRPKKIVVISNYSIESCFDGVDAEAIRRRFVVREFGALPPKYHSSFRST